MDTAAPEEHGNTPYGLSPTNWYVTAGAEGGETSSYVSTSEDEETVEEGLATFFTNPSYRAANPELLEPVDSEEDWGDVPPVLLPQSLQEPPSQAARYAKRQRYLQRRRERRRQNWREGSQYQYHRDSY